MFMFFAAFAVAGEPVTVGDIDEVIVDDKHFFIKMAISLQLFL